MSARMRIVGSLLIALMIALTQPGCEGRRGPGDRSPLPQEDAEFLLAIVLDLSGSFHETMQKGGKGYRFVLGLTEKFFKDRIGSNDRVVIVQLSGTVKSLLWDGTPKQLKKEFKTAEAFNDFLRSKADPGGSRVHDTIADTLDYVLDDPGVAEGKTRPAVFVLSDMEDNFGDPEGSKQRVIDSLRRYGKQGGVIGLYWVSTFLVPEWRKNFRDAGIRSGRWVVIPDITSDPQLPEFE